jgi:hypothetical protein
VDIARGEWLYFLGADDVFADDKALERVFVGHAKAVGSSDYVYGNVFWGVMGEVYDGRFSIEDLRHRNICLASIRDKKAI